MGNTIHPTALVAEQAVLGDGNEVGAYAVIEPGVTLGDHNRIAAHAVLKRGTRMGDHNQVSEHAVLGGEPQDLKFDPQTVSYLVIGDHNVFREAVTVNRGSQPEQATVLGDHNFMMTTAHIGHDCKVGNHNIFANAIALAGHVTMEDRVFVSGGVMIHQFTQVGTLAMLGGNSKVTQDCLPYMITDGNPARVRGLNLVGLKRAGLSAAELKALKSAFRILFGGGSSLAEVKSQLGALDSSHARHLVRFIDNSRRGYHRQKGA